MTFCRLRGVATAVPANVVPNSKFYDLLGGENAAKRLFGSIGIQERRWALPGMTALDLCVAAGNRLLDDMAVDRNSIGAVVLVTQSPDFNISPASACVAQWKLGITNDCMAFDVNQGCSGYVYGLAIAKNLVTGGQVKRVLLLVGDTISRLCNPDDPATVPLFGDAGTATLIEISEEPGVLECYFNTDGSGWNVLATPVGGSRYPTMDTYLRTAPEEVKSCFKSPTQVNMDGDKVFSFCMNNVPGLVRATAEKNHVQPAEFEHVIFHQANLMMMEALRRKSGLEKDRFLLSIHKFGNTTVATIPVTMTQEAAKLQRGGLCLMAGFGVGLTLSGAAVRLDSDVVYSPLVEI